MIQDNFASVITAASRRVLSRLRHDTFYETSRINSLWPIDAIWPYKTWWTLPQVMAGCLTAPSHYLNECWLTISEVSWHSPAGKFTKNTQDIYHCYEIGNYWFNIAAASPHGQRVKIVVHNRQSDVPSINPIYSLAYTNESPHDLWFEFALTFSVNT